MEYIYWLCLLIIVQAVIVALYVVREIRRPTPADQMLRKHFGGV